MGKRESGGFRDVRRATGAKSDQNSGRTGWSLDQLRTENINRVLVFAGLVVILSLVLLFFARDAIRELVVVPLSYWFWALGIFFDTTPQIFFWLVIVLFLSLTAWRSVLGKRKVYAPPPVDMSEAAGREKRGRASFWLVKVHQMQIGHGTYNERAFHLALSRLLVEVLAYRYRLPVAQMENYLREGNLGLPEDVNEYALYSMRQPEAQYNSFFVQWWQGLVEWLRLLISSRGSARPVDPRVERILNYIEDELEVIHDDSRR